MLISANATKNRSRGTCFRTSRFNLQRRLARRLRPFLLRRRKADVARELPKKIEQVVPCELGPTQRATYDALLREIQQGIGKTGTNDGAMRMRMLTGLLRLRQTCCDLRLLGALPNDLERNLGQARFAR